MNHRYVASAFIVFVMIAMTGLVVGRDGFAAAAEPAVADLPLMHVADIPLPGRASRLDYESDDPGRHLLFIAHLSDSEAIVVDTRTSHHATWRLSTARTTPGCWW